MIDEDGDKQPSGSGVFYQSSRDDPSSRPVNSMSQPVTGNAEFDILRNEETAAACWNKCQKYSGHNSFIAASPFNVEHLPLECSDYSVHTCIQLMSDLTVSVKIRRPGSPSPIVDSSHEVNDAPSVTRMCTGFFSHFDIRSWASLFEYKIILKQRSTKDNAQTAGSEEFFESVDEFDLNRIKEQIVSEKDSDEMKEFVRHFCPERLRHLCLLVWPAVKRCKDRITVFCRVLTYYMNVCYEIRPHELDVTTLSPQDFIDHFAISSAMFTDDGVSCRDPTSTSDDATINISGDPTTNMSGDATTDISGDPTTNISGDPTTNISGDPTTNISGDPTTNISDDTTTNISGDPTTNISGDPTPNISDDTTPNISGDPTANISDDAATNMSGDPTPNISDDAATNISGDPTANISDDTTPNMSGDPKTNISDDATTSISGDETPNMSGDPTTNISDDTTPNIFGDPATNISDDTTPNISGDPTTNIFGDATAKLSSDTITNISDYTTSNISDGPTTSTSADSTTTNVQHLPSSTSCTEAGLTRVSECKSIPNPQPLGYIFDVLTDRRAVLDNEEAANTVVDLEIEGEVKHLYGQTVQRVSDFCDLQYLQCVTHEVKVAEWIKEKSAAFGKVYRHVCQRVSRPLAVICSYPHGHRKMISVGAWTARFSHDCGQTPPLAYVSYEYTTPTCPGSTGAPVLILGQMENYPHVFNEVQSHYGTHVLGGKKSGIGLAFRI